MASLPSSILDEAALVYCLFIFGIPWVCVEEGGGSVPSRLLTLAQAARSTFDPNLACVFFLFFFSQRPLKKASLSPPCYTPSGN